jgi:hypothetical protein
MFLQQNGCFSMTTEIAKQFLLISNTFQVSPTTADPLQIVKKTTLPSASHNWIHIERMTCRIPKFRTFYLLGLTVFSIYQCNQIPQEYEFELDWINLELFFSLLCDRNQIEMVKSHLT